MNVSAGHSILPPLSPEEASHSKATETHIRERIAAAGGWISFARFMELALYSAGLGYYSAGSTKLGPAGDFVTAPEMSDLFSRCVARQCEQILKETGGGILEIGAGSGKMAAAILAALAEVDQLPDSYAILEVSADLAERQRAHLSQLPTRLRDRIIWLDRLPERPGSGVILANEVLDALPVHRFVWRGGAVAEVGVGLAQEGFEWRENPEGSAVAHGDDPVLAAAREAIAPVVGELPDGYTSEICLAVEPWICGVADCLHKGVLLLFDYGLPRAHYYHPQRVTGTLRCHFKHRAHDDPFINVGVQDITAWVDFTQVAEASLSAKLDVAGFATQAAFLLGTGIVLPGPDTLSPAESARLAGEARRLLLPGEMGEAFKVMALSRDWREPLIGFAHQDLRSSL